jgi:uroporphyrinogen-III synthase
LGILQILPALFLPAAMRLTQLQRRPMPLHGFQNQPFVVGSATAAAAKQAGFKNIIIGNGGGAGLVEPIRQALADTNPTKPQKANLLWPSALEISFDMTVAMRRHEIAVQRWPAYQMVANSDLAPRVCAALAKNYITAVVAMSPRSIQILRENMDAAGTRVLPETKLT